MNKKLEFEEAIKSFSDEIKEIARVTREMIYKIFPDVVEVVWLKQKNIRYGTSPKKKTEHFCYIMPASNHLNLGFNYCTDLDDPKLLLAGTGKLFRHIKIKSIEDLNNSNLIQL